LGLHCHGSTQFQEVKGNAKKFIDDLWLGVTSDPSLIPLDTCGHMWYHTGATREDSMAANGLTLEGMCNDYLFHHCSVYRYRTESMRKWLTTMAFNTRQANDIKQNEFFMMCLLIINDKHKWSYIFRNGKGHK